MYSSEIHKDIPRNENKETFRAIVRACAACAWANNDPAFDSN